MTMGHYSSGQNVSSGLDGLDYRGKVILAPMVRMGNLPFRSMCLDNGADIAYSEEIIDVKLLQSRRVENIALGCVDFVIPEEVLFRTHPCEKSRVVLQIGTADPKSAVGVAQMVENDVAGLDINMGCPKDYSVRGGMGAALLKNPDLIEEILRQTRAVMSKPLTCKIRLLGSIQETVNLVKRIEATGVDAIAVHGRMKEERPTHKNNHDAIRAVTHSVSLPVIANGGSSDVHEYGDIEKFRLLTGASSVMIARAAQSNPSIFRREGPLSRERMIMDFLKRAVDYDLPFRHAKYVIQHLYGDTSVDLGPALLGTRDFFELAEVFGFEKYYETKRQSWIKLAESVPETTAKRLFENVDNVVEEHVDYTPISKRLKRARDTHTPKSMLQEYCTRNYLSAAEFNFLSSGRTFCGSVTVDGKTYATTVPHRTKKEAEQAATVVALKHLIPGFDI